VPDPAPVIRNTLAIIGGGPAGLMAAWVAASKGIQVDLYERKASVGRKFLIAGRGGLNLTHADAPALFRSRYGAESDWVASWLDHFDAEDVRAFAAELGIDTFVGTSGRVFPHDMKAAPMLRQWVQRLRDIGVRFHVRHELKQVQPHDEGLALEFDHDGVTVQVVARTAILALGGASWPQLGSDGSFVPWLSSLTPITPFSAANCGFDVGWSDGFRARMAGQALKSIRLSVGSAAQTAIDDPIAALKGECMISDYGLEGSLIYARSRQIRETLVSGPATLQFDLVPTVSMDRLAALWPATGSKRSLSERMRRLPGMDTTKVDLVFECIKHFGVPMDRMPELLKQLPITVQQARPVAEAISSAGGVAAPGLDEGLMVRTAPGLFCAGEMLDWDAPTGGYLLTACFASGVVAAEAAIERLAA